MNRPLAIGAAAIGLLALATLLSSLYTVAEGEQALVVRLGAPTGVITEPGLKTKAPFIDNVIIYDARLLLLEPPTEQVILGDQKRLEVQTYARFRIADPLRFYQSLRTVEQARAELAQIVSSSLRREFGQVALSALLSNERDRVVENIKKEVAAKAAPLGVEVVEVHIHRADLPFETSQAIYNRMKSERQREAKQLRAQGFEWAQQIQARAERERTVMLSEAQRGAKIDHGEGDAQANRLLADAFNKDVQFYRFYRSLQTYRQALADSGPTLVLSPDAEFLRLLTAGPDRPSPQTAPAPGEGGALK
ncbi:MAG: protease modulator HflC [Roseiarcus sp.]